MTATQAELDAMQRQKLIPPQFAVFVMDEVDGGMTMLYAGTYTECERRMRMLGTVRAGDGMEAVELGVYARDPERDRWVQVP